MIRVRFVVVVVICKGRPHVHSYKNNIYMVMRYARTTAHVPACTLTYMHACSARERERVVVEYPSERERGGWNKGGIREGKKGKGE